MGLPTALLLSNAGHKVLGYDIDEKKLDLLRAGNLPFEEKGLRKLFKKVKSNIDFVSTLHKSDVYIVTVPTPLTNDKKCDLSFVKSAVKKISNVIEDGNLVIIESTVSPGVTEKVVKPLLDKSNKKYFLSFASEKAIPGDTLYEMQNNNRIIGGINKESANKAKEIYSSFVKSDIFLTDCNTAEIVKLMENTFRDVNIALANEFAKISKEFNIDIWEAIKLANKHPRVNIHKPGPGVGGHCISIDPWFLLTKNSDIVLKAREINDSMPNYVFKFLKDLTTHIKNPVVTVFGVAYKGNVDDTRESPTITFIEICLKEGFKVRLFDPYVKDFKYELVSIDEATKGSDCIVIITDHDEFKKINPNSLNMRNLNVFDTRNIIDPDKWKKAGFNVKLLGYNKLDR